MNSVHVHLLLTHVPVIGAIFGFVLLAISIGIKSGQLYKVSIGIFLAVAVFAIPVYFTGEGAEEIIEDLPGVEEHIIEQHEEAALVSLILIEILGVFSLVQLVLFGRTKSLPIWFAVASLVLSIFTAGLVARTANLGGQIRHTEIRADFKALEHDYEDLDSD